MLWPLGCAEVVAEYYVLGSARVGSRHKNKLTKKIQRRSPEQSRRQRGRRLRLWRIRS